MSGEKGARENRLELDESLHLQLGEGDEKMKWYPVLILLSSIPLLTTCGETKQEMLEPTSMPTVILVTPTFTSEESDLQRKLRIEKEIAEAKRFQAEFEERVRRQEESTARARERREILAKERRDRNLKAKETAEERFQRTRRGPSIFTGDDSGDIFDDAFAVDPIQEALDKQVEAENIRYVSDQSADHLLRQLVSEYPVADHRLKDSHSGSYCYSGDEKQGR